MTPYEVRYPSYNYAITLHEKDKLEQKVIQNNLKIGL